MNSVPNETFNRLIEIVHEDYQEQGKCKVFLFTSTDLIPLVSENTLSKLLFMFDSSAVQALDMVDRKCIYLIVSPSGRELYKVERSASKFHICLKNSNYCTCPSFIFHVIQKGQVMCKHKLAATLSTAMGLNKEVQYSDETIALMLLGEINS